MIEIVESAIPITQPQTAFEIKKIGIENFLFLFFVSLFFYRHEI